MTATLIQPHSAQTTPSLLRMSEQEYWRVSGEGDRVEWVDGSMIVMSPVSIRHVLIVGFLNAVLSIYARRRGLGVVLGPEFAIRFGTPPRIITTPTFGVTLRPAWLWQEPLPDPLEVLHGWGVS